MKTIRLVKKLERIQLLTHSELRSTAAAFNDSTAVVGCIQDYIGSELDILNKELANPEKLFKNSNSDNYVAFKLAERGLYLKLLSLLTEQITIDDDQSGEYNE